MSTTRYSIKFRPLNEGIKRGYKGIAQRDVKATIQNIEEELFPILRLKNESANIRHIGSSGKRKDKDSYSKDIDFAISSKALLERNNKKTPDGLMQFLEAQVERLGYECSVDEEGGTLTVDWPIKGKPKNGTVEVNLNLVENLDWVSFTRYCPDYGKDESLYSQKYRETLLESVADVVYRKVLEYSESRDTVKTYEAYSFKSMKGLTAITYTFEGKHGNLKQAKMLPESEQVVSSDPDEIARTLFGASVKPTDLLTFESVLESIKSKNFEYPKKRKRILEHFAELCAARQLDLPNLREVRSSSNKTK